MSYEPDWYDTHCPTCDAPEPTHTPTCAVVTSELKAETRTLRGERNAFDLAAALDKLGRVRELVSDPCTPGCCDHCDGKNEGWEMVLAILDEPATPGENREEQDHG